MEDRLEMEQEVCYNIYVQQTMRSSAIKKNAVENKGQNQDQF